MSYYKIADVIIEAPCLPKSFSGFKIAESSCSENVKLRINQTFDEYTDLRISDVYELRDLKICKVDDDVNIAWIYQSREGYGQVYVDSNYHSAEYYCKVPIDHQTQV